MLLVAIGICFVWGVLKAIKSDRVSAFHFALLLIKQDFQEERREIHIEEDNTGYDFRSLLVDIVDGNVHST